MNNKQLQNDLRFKFEDLKKENAKLYINLFGLSGSGKTYSSLLIASALSSSLDKILIIDTENRANIYGNDFKGVKRFKKQDISLEEIIQVIYQAKTQNFEVIIIDSLTPLWDGKNGLLTEVDNSSGDSRHGAKWKKPKSRITAFTQFLKNSDMHIITTSLGKEKMDNDMKPTGEIEPIFERPKFEPYLDMQLLIENDGHIKKIIKGLHFEAKAMLEKEKRITKNVFTSIKNWLGKDSIHSNISSNDFETSKTHLDELARVDEFFEAIKDLSKEEFINWYNDLSKEDKELYKKNANFIKSQKDEYLQYLEEKKTAKSIEEYQEPIQFLDSKPKTESKENLDDVM